MPQVPLFNFFAPYKRNQDQDTTMNQDLPVAQDPPVDSRSVEREENTAFAAAAGHYVPRPIRHEPERATVFMHPLAMERPISHLKPMEVDVHSVIPPVPSVPKPIDIGSLQAAIEKATPERSQAPNSLSTSIEGTSASHHVTPSAPKPMDPQPQFTFPVIAQAIHSAPESMDSQNPLPSPPFIFEGTATSHAASMGQDQNTPYKRGRTAEPRKRRIPEATEKTRLVEQPDLTTRDIIEKKEQIIAELRAQVKDYERKMDAFANRMEELERRSCNNNQVVSTPSSITNSTQIQGQDVHMVNGDEKRLGQEEGSSNTSCHPNVEPPPSINPAVSLVNDTTNQPPLDNTTNQLYVAPEGIEHLPGHFQDEQDVHMANGGEERVGQEEGTSSTSYRPNVESQPSINPAVGLVNNTTNQPPLNNTTNQLYVAPMFGIDRLPGHFQNEQDVHMANGGEDRPGQEEGTSSTSYHPNVELPPSINPTVSPANNTTNQLQLDSAPLQFDGDDINMGEGRRRHGKQRATSKELSEDEEDFGPDLYANGTNDSSEDDDIGDQRDQWRGEPSDSQPSVPKPIFHFQRPRGGGGPRLRVDPQTPSSPSPIPIPNITNMPLPPSLLPFSLTAEHVAAIAQVVIGMQATPKATPRVRKKNVTGTIKAQTDRTTDPRRSVLVAAVRKHMNALLRINKDKDIQWHAQPPKAIADVFAAEQGPGPNLIPMQLYFDGKAKHHWNRTLATSFVEDFTEHVGPQLNLKEAEEIIVYDLFWQRFQNLRQLHKSWLPKEGEDDRAVSHRKYQQDLKQLKTTRRDSRRKCMNQLRISITEGNAVKPDGTRDDVWHFLWQVATQLGLGGTSSDESGEEGVNTSRKAFVIRSVGWRSDELVPYLQMIDRDFNRFNRYGNKRPGNPLRDRVRLPTAKASVRPAIRGLPKNFYDKTWYANLTNEEVLFLQAKPDLAFPVIVQYNN
ncbi:hypothetical protein GALMADRAFT_136359 [Galerina marginata CBS 339.88]|uniref:Uncharacterized protein n=1 Tax=Galerina marginata (strain CBS 339.88) TaxID=685588 RepID=A0A067TL93_GALM3|nr:hypothetical protein GALMADRAFT_136359 [Galerina marginata CBS 339.88]